MANAGQPALLLTTYSDSEAELVRQLLAHHGISCAVSSQVPHSVLPFTVDGLGEVRIHVAASALAEARRVLAAYRSGGREPERTWGKVVPMPVRVEAATRIDLAGGTLDIWPLYLLLDEPVTVNLAINLHAVVEAAALSGSVVALRSDDQDEALEAPSPEDLELEGPLPLAARLVRSFAPGGGVRVRTAASVPAGSGLGGSSALAAGIAVALARLTGQSGDLEVHALARRLANLEAQVLGIPTGVQDYYPPLLGGVLELSFAPEGVAARRLPVKPTALEERLVLVYEGASRSSGISNLDMLRRFLEGEAGARGAMRAVAVAARELADALRRGDLDAAGEAMAAEMAARRQLSPTVMTPATERLFAAARRAGALGAKVCGAGGGGCSVYWARGGRRAALVRVLEEAGGRVLPFRVESAALLPEAAAATG